MVCHDPACAVPKNIHTLPKLYFCGEVISAFLFLRAAYKFGRRVHFALRRKVLKPPIARLHAI